MAPTAEEIVATMMAICPAAASPSPTTALAPATKTTPPNPVVTPNSRPTVSGSCRVQAKLMRNTKIGVVEFRMAASALSTDCWPIAMSPYGIAHPTQPCTNSRPTKSRRAGILQPMKSTMIQSTAAANATRTATKVTGGILVSAILFSA